MVVESGAEKYLLGSRISRRRFIEIAAALTGAGALTAWGFQRAEGAGGDSTPENPLFVDFYQSKPGDGVKGHEVWLAMNFDATNTTKEVTIVVTGGDVKNLDVQFSSAYKYDEIIKRRAGQQYDSDFEPTGRGNPTYVTDDEGNKTQTKTLIWKGGDNKSGQWLVRIAYNGDDEASYTYQAVATP